MSFKLAAAFESPLVCYLAPAPFLFLRHSDLATILKVIDSLFLQVTVLGLLNDLCLKCAVSTFNHQDQEHTGTNKHKHVGACCLCWILSYLE